MTFSLFRGRWAVRLLVFLGLLLVLFVLQRGFFRSSPEAPVSSPSVRTSAEMQQTWRSEVQTILRQYDQDQNAAKAREALLGLTVAREDQAKHLGLVGIVENLQDGTVHVVAEGDESELKLLVGFLKEGNLFSRVDAVDEKWGNAGQIYNSFEIKYRNLSDRF
jgi:acylphosphatase